ncbi:MAG: GT-D fold domain-containing glycosyltransferase [Alphaproteobacteria bacterium]|nr:GT-D fold domain-containing glycosyltransferase [Alphaproteobacteria bacterium]
MSLSKLFNNIKYLMKTDLRRYDVSRMTESIIEETLIELSDKIPDLFNRKPKFLSFEETLKEIIENKKSICRFGDGEFNNLVGNSIPFQKGNKILSKRLKEVLSSCDDNIIIGINEEYFTPKRNRPAENRAFDYRNCSFLRGIIYANIHLERIYCPSSISMGSSPEYFNQIRKIWQNRDVTIVCGKGIFSKFKNDIFDNTKSVEFVYGERLNAFAKYNDLLNRCSKIDKNRLVIIILGPTATVLAYDMAKLGYQALDFGHVAKKYDVVMGNTDLAKNFFQPD